MQLHQLQTASTAEKDCFDMTINFSNYVCHCGAGGTSRSCLHALINRARLRSRRRCFLILSTVFFFLFSRCFLILFPFGLFSFILTADPADHAHGSIYDFTFDISPEFYFGKGISKALDLHTGQAYESRGDSRISR